MVFQAYENRVIDRDQTLEDKKDMGKQSLSFDITFPVFNERNQLEKSILDTIEFCNANKISELVITIADNGSIDGTSEIAQQLEQKHQVVRYIKIDQKGVGIALKKAWLSSSCDILGAMDIDLSTDLRHFKEVYDRFQTNNVDLIVGSRLLDDSVVVGRSLIREITSRGFNQILNKLLKIRFTDGMCGFKFIYKEVFEKLMLIGIQNDEWFFETELLVKAELNSFKILEIPVYWEDDRDSKVTLIPLSLRYLKEIWRLRKELNKR